MNHVVSVQVENQPGVLARVASMFARRGFNIHSLAVGPTADPTLSRMTLVVDAPDLEQIIKQLYKLVHVVKVTELAEGERIECEIMMVRVSAEPKRRPEIMDVASAFHAEPVDVGAGTLTFELAGTPEQLADFLEVMRTYGIISLAKSGRIALPKDAKSGEHLSKLRSA